MLRNYKFIIAYDGTRFFGWERQPGRDTRGSWRAC